VGDFDRDKAARVLSGEDPFDEATMLDEEHEEPEPADRPVAGAPVGAHRAEATRP
jgi:hypothetical protein